MTELLYSLPFACPIPWPTNPSYPIELTSTDLPTAYLDALYSPSRHHATLDLFARHLLSLLQSLTPDALPPLLRSLIHPAHDFDRRWRSILPSAVIPTPDAMEEDPPAGKVDKKRLSEVEKEMLRSAHERWVKAEEEEGKKAVGWVEEKLVESVPEAGVNGKEGATDGAKEGVRDKPTRWTVQEQGVGEWLRDMELLETRLQSLLLLTLLSLDPSLLPPPPARRNKDPERHASTLDPALLLDFLTDRLQVWAAIKSIAGASSSTDSQSQAAPDAMLLESEKDDSQLWWQDIVEPLYSSRLPSDLLSHHRTKLFPSTSSTSALSSTSSLLPVPSPFKAKDRSLLSLDKSARRKWSSAQTPSESPTMKRLVSRSSIGEGDDVFKVPVAPNRRAAVELATKSEEEGTTRARPRKQERPRPLPRGDSVGASSKGLASRREVSLGRRASSVGLGTKKKVVVEEKKEVVPPLGRKRKSVSPRKLTSKTSIILVPDTPAKHKPAPHRSITNLPPRSSFTRAASLPSFAALGAAFRPGAPEPSGLPVGIPSPPELEMDWEEEGGEGWGRETPERRTGWGIPDT